MRILDCTCGDRGIWMDKQDERAVFTDLRQSEGGDLDHNSNWRIKPDLQADARNLPFPDDTFDAAVFDPPHIVTSDGMEHLSGWVEVKYGALRAETWQDDIRRTFGELWRVVRSGGTVSFKFSDRSADFQTVVDLAPEPPLVGTPVKSKASETRWYLFGVG